MRPALDGVQDELVVGEGDVLDGDALAPVVVESGGEDGGVEVLLQLLVREVDRELVRFRVAVRVRVRVRVRVPNPNPSPNPQPKPNLLEAVGLEALEAEDVEHAEERKALEGGGGVMSSGGRRGGGGGGGGGRGGGEALVDRGDQVVEQALVQRLRERIDGLGRLTRSELLGDPLAAHLQG